MHDYSKLILKQRMLLGLLQFCSMYILENETKTISDDYEKLHKLLDDEREKLINEGLNPSDFHPMPVYAKEGTREEVFKERQFKLKDYLENRK